MRLTVPGDPVALERARKGKHGFYLPPRSVEFRERVREAWKAAGSPTVEGGLVVTVRGYWSRPKSHYRTKAMLLRPDAPRFPRPDVDNLVKGILDALQGHAFEDDNQVVALAECSKGFSAQARTEIVVLGEQ